MNRSRNKADGAAGQGIGVAMPGRSGQTPSAARIDAPPSAE